MSVDLSPVISATTEWLLRCYPGSGGALDTALAQVQAHQAATVAAWLRYPTAADAALVAFVGPGGSDRLDRLAGSGPVTADGAEPGWRTWVDEVVASWAACLLTTPSLARAAVAALGGCAHTAGIPLDFRRLTDPDEGDLRAVPLLRHPDLQAALAALHRDSLVRRLHDEPADEQGPLEDPVTG